jgi:cytidylate kinase
MTSGFVVAIDGPAASGKSTTARLVAERLGFLYLDTGAMYRAVTWNAIEEGIALDDAAELAALANRIRLDMVPTPDGGRVLVDGADVTERIRAPSISRVVSRVSSVAGVRVALVRRQREIGRTGRIVLEGRDIGTVVFPNADVKIYLEASLDERAARRRRELRALGVEQELDELVDEIAARDRLDSEREASPLRRAADAIGLDTTGLTIEEQVDRVVEIVHRAVEGA